MNCSKGLAVLRADDLQANLTVALDSTDDDGLVAGVAAPDVLALTTDVGLIDFNDAVEQRLVVVAHRAADAMTHVPRRLVARPERALKLLGADPLLGLADQVDGEKPLTQRQVRVVEERPCRDRELVAA